MRSAEREGVRGLRFVTAARELLVRIVRHHTKVPEVFGGGVNLLQSASMTMRGGVLAMLFLAAVQAALGGTAVNVSLSASAASVNYGAALTLSATVAPTAGVTGKVTFYDDATVLGIATVVSGKATLSTIALPSGPRRLRAFYAGDANNNAGTSAVLPQTVKAIPGTGFNVVPNLHDAGTTAVFVLAADFDGDGKADLAVANSDSNDVAVLRGRGTGSFQAPVSYAVGTTPVALATGDFNGDGKADLVVANSASGDLSILTGKGDGTFLAAVSVMAGGAPVGLAVSDFNGDGMVDIAVANGASTITILLGRGDGTFQSPVDYAVGAGPRALLAADFNGDGKADLAITSSGSGTVTILLGKGDGTFPARAVYAAGDSSVGIATGDFNGDGRPDLAVVGGTLGARVLLGNGDGTFRAPVMYQPNGTAIVVADFNGDGKADLASAGSDLDQALGNGDGTFQPITSYQPPTSTLYHFAVADFNGDGRADMVTANGQDNNLTVLLAEPFAITGVANAAGGGTGVQSGSWVALYGSGLSLTMRTWETADFVGSALPTALDGVSVRINNKPAAVFFVSPAQVNVQAPADTATGPVPVQVTNSYGTTSGTVMLQNYAPAFFAYLAKYPVGVHLDGSYLAPVGAFGSQVASRPAKPGETIVLFGTGFGPTSPVLPIGQILTGFAGLADPAALRVRIGGVVATVPFAGLVAAGEFQLNIVVPPGLANGDQALVADIAGQSTQALIFVPVQN